MRFALLVVLCLLAFPLLADEVPAGVCGGITWLTDPDLPSRVHVFSAADLPHLAAIRQALIDSCQRPADQQLHQSDAGPGRPFDCAVVFTVREPNCTPSAVSEEYLQRVEVKK